MNDERDTLHDDEDASLGAPVTELAALVAPPADGEGAGRLLSRVRGRINRRQLTASTLDVTLMGMFRTFFEFLSLFIQALAGGGTETGSASMGTDFGLRATFEQVLSSLVGAVADFVPRLVTAVIVILFGLLVAKIAERVVRALFERLRLNHLLQRVGLNDTLQRFGLRDSPGRLLSRTIYILLVVLFVQSVARAVGLDAIAEAISSFFRYLPNLVAAFLVLLLGMMVSQFMGRAVARSAEEAGVDFAPLLGRIVSSLLLFVVGLMAISQLRIDTEIVRAVVLVLLAGFALAFALSFGLGSRQVSRDILAGFYLRKLLSAGDEVEVAGTRGTLAGITAVHTLIEVDGRTVSVPNRQFMDERAGYRRD